MDNDTEIPSPDPQPPAEIPAAPEKPKRHGLQNLIPSKPGEVRNPHGRPKGSLNRKTIFRRLLEAHALPTIKKLQEQTFDGAPDDDKPVTIADQLAAAMLIKALSGDLEAMNQVLDNTFDKMADKIHQTGNLSIGNALNSVKKGGPAPLPKLAAPASQEQPPCTTPTTPEPSLPRLKPNTPTNSDAS